MPTCRVCRYRFEGTRCPICGHRPPPLRPARARATPARARRAVVRAPARPPRQIRGGPTIEGIVHQTAGPHQEPAPLSFWKFASGLLGIMVFAPLLIMLWMFKVAFRIAFGILGFGFRGGGGGRSWYDEIFIFNIVSRLLHRDEPVHVYHHIIQAPNHLMNARQVGEFQVGRVYPGHRVRLNGKWQSGTFVIQSGRNLTLGTELRLRRDSWATFFWILMGIAVFGFLLLAGLSNVPRPQSSVDRPESTC